MVAFTQNQREEVRDLNDLAGALGAKTGIHQATYIALENHPNDSRLKIKDDDICQTLSSRMGTGGGNEPMVIASFEGNGARPSHKGSGIGNGERSFTLNATEVHAVAISEVHSPLCAEDGRGSIHSQMQKNPEESFVYGICSKDSNSMKSPNPHSGFYEADTARTLDAGGASPACNQGGMAVMESEYLVRRLTPIETERLQGMPDMWCYGLCDRDLDFYREAFEVHRKVVTKAKKPKTDKQIESWLDRPLPDSEVYQIQGNGCALPNVLFVLEGIAESLD